MANSFEDTYVGREEKKERITIIFLVLDFDDSFLFERVWRLVGDDEYDNLVLSTRSDDWTQEPKWGKQVHGKQMKLSIHF